nr:rhophilin 2 [Hymenolepis microstoma]
MVVVGVDHRFCISHAKVVSPQAEPLNNQNDNANERSKVFSKSHKHMVEEALRKESETYDALKSKMDFLNSSFSTYQNLESRLPVIPIGLKETYEIDFRSALSSFITSHYHEDWEKYAEGLDKLTEYRKRIMEPQRSNAGLKDFKSYYNLLNTIERRFFDESIHHGFRFSWSDAFTGERHSQRSPAFEKGSLIFNYAALCSQIAAACAVDAVDSLSEQTKWFVQARANLQVLQESFAHAPSRDMSAELLGFLIRVMQVQAQEAVFLKQMIECQQESEITRLTNYIGGAAFPYVQLHKYSPRPRKSSFHSRHHRPRSAANVPADCNGAGSRPQSRIKRTISSLSLGSRGRSKSRGLDDNSSLSGRFSSLSNRSGYSSASTLSIGNLDGGSNGFDGEAITPPTTRKDAHQLGQVCLAEALHWAQQALKTIEQTADLSQEIDIKNFVAKDVTKWSEQLNMIKNTNNRADGAPATKKRHRRLQISRSFNRSSPAVDTASVISTNSTSSKKSLGSRKRPPKTESSDNPWTAPTFLQNEIELPKDLSTTVLKSGRNHIDDSKDPFRMLGPLKYFNARKGWSEAYTVQLVRDEKVVYGFSIQGTGPVEILGVDANTPASDNGMRTGDLVIGINGMDARFMTHNEAVAAIRFGEEGYEQAIKAQSSAADNSDNSDEVADKPSVSYPPEVDVVQLTMIRPLAPMQPQADRKQSIYLELPRDQTPTTTKAKSPIPFRSFMSRHHHSSRSKSRPVAKPRKHLL